MSRENVKKCPSCSHLNREEAEFCEKCGKLLEKPASKFAFKTYTVWFVVVIVLAFAVVSYYNYQLFAPLKGKYAVAGGEMREEDPHKAAENGLPALDEKIVKQLQARIGSAPEAVEPLVDLGNYLFDKMRYQDALHYYLHALEKNEKLPDVWVDAGVAAYNLHNLQAAERYFSEALNINPLHAKALYNLGIVYYNINEKEKVAEVWGKLVKERPETPEAQQAKRFLENM